LLYSIPILKGLLLKRSSVFTGLFNGFVFCIQCCPSMLDTHLLQSSVASFCTWNLSVTLVASEKHRLQISSMLPAISRVISLTFFRALSGILCRTEMTVSSFGSCYNSNYRPFFPFCYFVGNDGIQFTMGKACLVNRKLFT
jgi:hypothetical protein